MLTCLLGVEGVGVSATAQVTSHTGPEKLSEALYNCALVVIPAGVPRKPGMTRDDLFNINASAEYNDGYY